jgi:DNA-binding CsgD family transcriptional regulator
MVLVTEGRAGVSDAYGELTETLACIRAARITAAVWPSVKDFAARFGYSHVLALDLTRVVGGARQALLYTDEPKVLTEFDRELLASKHPVVQRCLENPETFLISEFRNDPAHRDARWLQLTAEVVRQGEGLVVPVYRAGLPIAGANFGGLSPDTSALTRALLQVVIHAAVERTLALRDGQSPAVATLSAREAQCLRQVAVGHADAEIGALLGISPRTVRFHVDSAKAKLGVSTRIQAVAKALRERIIAV